MNPKLRLQSRNFVSRVAELGFKADLPADWISHELPAEEVDFSNPTSFMALALVTAPHAAIVFAFAARPAYEDGTLEDWAGYNLNSNGLQAAGLGQALVAGVPAVCGEALQQSDLGPMLVRFAFLEDGNRLVNLTLTAPEMLADSVRDAWIGMLGSFTLETPRGSRFAPGTPHPQPASAGQPAEATVPGAPAPSAAGRPPQTEIPEPPADSTQLASNSESDEPRTTFTAFALDATPASLDPDAPFNANLRDRGIGLVPNCVSIDATARTARMAAGAIMARFEVPFGWHVIDDGRRTLVFEPTGKIQISLNLIPTSGRKPGEILDEIEGEMRRDYPAPEFLRGTHGRLHAIGARNIAVGDEPIEQYHLLSPHRDESMLLRARVTTSPEKADEACNLAELILESCDFGGSTRPES